MTRLKGHLRSLSGADREQRINLQNLKNGLKAFKAVEAACDLSEQLIKFESNLQGLYTQEYDERIERIKVKELQEFLNHFEGITRHNLSLSSGLLQSIKKFIKGTTS